MAQPVFTIRFNSIIKPILTASLLFIPAATTMATSNAIATEVSQGCAAIGRNQSQPGGSKLDASVLGGAVDQELSRSIEKLEKIHFVA